MDTSTSAMTRVDCWWDVSNPWVNLSPPERVGENSPFQLLNEDWDHFEPMMHNALAHYRCWNMSQVRMLMNGPEVLYSRRRVSSWRGGGNTGSVLKVLGMNSVGLATGGGAGLALAHCIVRGHTPYGPS